MPAFREVQLAFGVMVDISDLGANDLWLIICGHEDSLFPVQVSDGENTLVIFSYMTVCVF